MTYEPRVYRKGAESPDLVSFSISAAETDLHIQAESRLVVEAREATRQARAQVEKQIRRQPEFATSLNPLPASPNAPAVVASMVRAAARAGTGPMAAVAGAIAEYVGERLLAHSRQVIVENGGDIFLATQVPRIVAVRAGKSSLSGRIGLVIAGGARLGVCTSSGIVGPSLSAGRADAAVVVAEDTALADAVATAVANRVSGPQDCQSAVAWAAELGDIIGVVVVCGETLAAWGEIELEPLGRGASGLDAPLD